MKIGKIKTYLVLIQILLIFFTINTVCLRTKRLFTPMKKSFKVTIYIHDTEMGTGTLNSDVFDTPSEEQQKGLFIDTSDIKGQLKGVMIQSGANWFIPYKNIFSGFIYNNPVVREPYLLTVFTYENLQTIPIKIKFALNTISDDEGEKIVVQLNNNLNIYKTSLRYLKTEAFTYAAQVNKAEEILKNANNPSSAGIQVKIRELNNEIETLETQNMLKKKELESIENDISKADKEIAETLNRLKEFTKSIIHSKQMIKEKETLSGKLETELKSFNIPQLQTEMAAKQKILDEKLEILKKQLVGADKIIDEAKKLMTTNHNFEQFRNKLQDIISL